MAEVGRIALGKAIQVEPAGEADGVFLRETPDRREIVDAEQCR